MVRETTFAGQHNGVTLRYLTKYGEEDVAGLLREIDLRAGLLREILVPPGAGIELTYAEKLREATDFVSQNPLPEEYGDFPFMAADVAVDGGTMMESAIAVLTRAEAFRTVGPIIEKMRRGARKALQTERDTVKVTVILNGLSHDGLIVELGEAGLTPEQINALMEGAR